jgi:hypothetical protein
MVNAFCIVGEVNYILYTWKGYLNILKILNKMEVIQTMIESTMMNEQEILPLDKFDQLPIHERVETLNKYLEIFANEVGTDNGANYKELAKYWDKSLGSIRQKETILKRLSNKADKAEAAANIEKKEVKTSSSDEINIVTFDKLLTYPINFQYKMLINLKSTFEKETDNVNSFLANIWKITEEELINYTADIMNKFNKLDDEQKDIPVDMEPFKKKTNGPKSAKPHLKENSRVEDIMNKYTNEGGPNMIFNNVKEDKSIKVEEETAPENQEPSALIMLDTDKPVSEEKDEPFISIRKTIIYEIEIQTYKHIKGKRFKEYLTDILNTIEDDADYILKSGINKK